MIWKGRILPGRKKTRVCAIGETEGLKIPPVDDYLDLKPGNEITGPSIMETEYTTVVVPPGYSIKIDQHLFSRMTRD